MATLTLPELCPRDLERWLANRAPEAVVGYAREGDQTVIGRYLNDHGLPVTFVDGKKAFLVGDGEILLPGWARQFDYEIDQLDDPTRPSTSVTAYQALAVLRAILMFRRAEGLD